jgi:hypothetical protein
MRWLVPLVLLLAGCSGHTHSSVSFGSASPHGAMHVHIDSAGALAAAMGLAVIAYSVTETERGTLSASNPRYVPEMDPSRRVSEQDCTKPLDWSLGNIRCK